MSYADESAGVTARKPRKLLDVVRARLRVRHYSLRTEQAHAAWIRRFILFHDKQHPREMGGAEVGNLRFQVHFRSLCRSDPNGRMCTWNRFARPILNHLRAVAHAADKDIEETIKWGMPCFTVGGKIVCNMAAFKQHCAFNLWHGKQILGEGADDAMGQFGRIEKKADLPPKKDLVALVRKAVRLRREGSPPNELAPPNRKPPSPTPSPSR